MKPIFFLFFVLFLIPTVYGEEFCSVDDSSSCEIEQGEITLDPLETNAFISRARDEVCIVYFYSETCPHCKNIKPFIDLMAEKYEDNIHLTQYDVSKPEHIALYNKLCSMRGYSGKSIPLIGINEIILVGESDIEEKLEEEIVKGLGEEQKTCPLEGHQCHDPLNNGGSGSTDSLIPSLKNLNWSSVLPVIFIAGIGDGINPCAFVILIFVMVFLQQISGSKKRLLKITLTYIIAIFITNTLLGILYFYFSLQVGYGGLIRNVIIIVSILAGLINIKDFFYYGKGISLGIPEASKKFLKGLITKASVPSSLVLGVSVAILEAPCSVPIYLAVIEVLKGEGSTIASVFPYIFVYNLMFILPLIVIGTAVYFGFKAHILEHQSLKSKKYMKLAIGLILIGLALALIKGWL